MMKQRPLLVERVAEEPLGASAGAPKGSSSKIATPSSAGNQLARPAGDGPSSRWAQRVLCSTSAKS